MIKFILPRQSNKVRSRILEQTKGFNLSASITLNMYMQLSNSNYKTYAVYQGTKCSKKTRLALEKTLIKQAGQNSINVLENPNDAYKDLARNITKTKLSFSPMGPNEQWMDYGLPYQKVNYQKGEGVIYAIINKETKSLYIGETNVYPLSQRIRHHKAYISKVASLKANGITPKPSAIKRMYEDIEKGHFNFTYSPIKNLENFSKQQRIQVERTFMNEALKIHPEGLYNMLDSSLTATKKESRPQRINPFIINGIWYDTAHEAAVAAGVSNTRTLKLRAQSFQFPSIISVVAPVNKIIPESKEIQEKIKLYFRKYGKPTANGTIENIDKILNRNVSPRSLSPYIFQGKWYDTKKEAVAAAAEQGISYLSFTYRTKSKNYSDVISVKKHWGKKIPDTPEIQEK